MNIQELLSSCTVGDTVDLELLTQKLFDDQDQKKIREHIKATS